MKKFGYMAVMTAALPLSAAAATITDLNSIFGFIRSILNTVLPLIIAAAVVYFVWGVFQLFLAKGEEGHEKAKTHVIYGIVALFIMVSVWGLVNILSYTLNLNNSGPVNGQNPLNGVPNLGSLPSNP